MPLERLTPTFIHTQPLSAESNVHAQTGIADGRSRSQGKHCSRGGSDSSKVHCAASGVLSSSSATGGFAYVASPGTDEDFFRPSAASSPSAFLSPLSRRRHIVSTLRSSRLRSSADAPCRRRDKKREDLKLDAALPHPLACDLRFYVPVLRLRRLRRSFLISLLLVRRPGRARTPSGGKSD